LASVKHRHQCKHFSYQDKTIIAGPVSDANHSDWRIRWPPSAASRLIQQNAPVLVANREKLHQYFVHPLRRAAKASGGAGLEEAA